MHKTLIFKLMIINLALLLKSKFVNRAFCASSSKVILVLKSFFIITSKMDYLNAAITTIKTSSHIIN